jgi:23S rRNA G2069 N7-methylase RlmK/C1962 C5-methylase RlmI
MKYIVNPDAWINPSKKDCYRILQSKMDFYPGLKVTVDNYIYVTKNQCKQDPTGWLMSQRIKVQTLFFYKLTTNYTNI